jgi:hypothetical protein
MKFITHRKHEASPEDSVETQRCKLAEEEVQQLEGDVDGVDPLDFLQWP